MFAVSRYSKRCRMFGWLILLMMANSVSKSFLSLELELTLDLRTVFIA